MLVQFKHGCRDVDGNISNYYSDFIVKVSPKDYSIVETKGRDDLDDPEKIKRLEQWCEDVSATQQGSIYKALYTRQEDWEKQQQRPRSFQEAARAAILL